MNKFLFFIAAIFLFSACSQTPPAITPDKESLLRTGRWKVTSGTVTLKKPNGIDTTLNYMPFVPPCHLDDYITFDSLNHGYVYPGTLLCYASDADSIGFNWRLLNNDNNIDILNVFNFFTMVYETIDVPYYFDTSFTSPISFDTVVFPPNVVELDTLWHVHFDSIPVTGNTKVYTGVNIYNADISNFSKSAMTISFKWYGTYPDSTGWHEISPIMRTDTLKFVLNFINF